MAYLRTSTTVRTGLRDIHTRVSKIKVRLETEKKINEAIEKYGKHPDHDITEYDLTKCYDLIDNIECLLKEIVASYEKWTNVDNGCGFSGKKWDSGLDSKMRDNPVEKIRVGLLGIYLYMIEINGDLREQMIEQDIAPDSRQTPPFLDEIRQLEKEISEELKTICSLLSTWIEKRNGPKRELVDSGFIKSSEINTPVEETREDIKQMEKEERDVTEI